MVGMYIIWGWIAWGCPIAAFWPLFFNDGGVFQNECYYMFYKGVVWYNPPKPYVVGASLFAPVPAPAVWNPEIQFQ